MIEMVFWFCLGSIKTSYKARQPQGFALSFGTEKGVTTFYDALQSIPKMNFSSRRKFVCVWIGNRPRVSFSQPLKLVHQGAYDERLPRNLGNLTILVASRIVLLLRKLKVNSITELDNIICFCICDKDIKRWSCHHALSFLVFWEFQLSQNARNRS